MHRLTKLEDPGLVGRWNNHDEKTGEEIMATQEQIDLWNALVEKIAEFRRECMEKFRDREVRKFNEKRRNENGR